MIRIPVSKYLLLTTVSITLLSSCGYFEGLGLDLEPQRVSTPIEDLQPVPLNNAEIDTTSNIEMPELDAVNMSDDQRLSRLENIVFDLQKDMNQIKPAFKNLMNLEGQISNLLVELQALRTGEAPQAMLPLGLKETASAPPTKLTESAPTATPTAEGMVERMPEKQMAEAPAPIEQAPKPMSAEEARPKTAMAPIMDEKKPAAKKQAPQVKTTSGPALVENIRIGSYPMKTRIVFDVKGKPEFAVDLDSSENLFSVNFMNGSISQNVSISPLKNTLVSAITETEAGAGRMVIFALNKQTRLLKQEILPPSKDSAYYRVFFDFAK